jgi:threonine dehydrogenase-like Zn-dependent dehydrogenase
VDAGPTAHNAAGVALARSGPRKAPHPVIGAGPVGFLVAELLRHDGAEFVVVEPHFERRAKAESRGHRVAGSISALTGHFTSVIDRAAVPDIVATFFAASAPWSLYQRGLRQSA